MSCLSFQVTFGRSRTKGSHRDPSCPLRYRICRRFFSGKLRGAWKALGLGSRRDGADWALWGLGGRLAGWPLTEHSDFRTLNLCPGRTLAGTLVLHFNPPSLKNKASPGTVFSGQTSTTSSSLGRAVKPAYSCVVGRRVVSMTLLGGRGRVRSRVLWGRASRRVRRLASSVAFRAIPASAPSRGPFFVAGRRRSTPPGLRFGVGGRLASGVGSLVAVEARRPSGAALMAEARLSQRRRC